LLVLKKGKMDTKMNERTGFETREKARPIARTGAQPYNGIQGWWYELDSLFQNLIIVAGISTILAALFMGLSALGIR